MAIEKRWLRVRVTNDKIIQVFQKFGEGQDDGIHYEEIDRTVGIVTPGESINGTNIVPEAQFFPGENLKGIILDTNHVEFPTGYIISLCFFTFDGNNSKLHMGRVNQGQWFQCFDSPRVYENTEILNVYSAFVNTPPSPSPIKIVQIRTPDGGTDIIIERH